MADEILGVLQTLYNHREVVREACIDFDGSIPDTPENEAAVRALKKHGLVWQMGELDTLSLSRPVIHLLRAAIQRRNRRLASGNVDRLWLEICERIEDYSGLIKEGRTADLELVEMDIRDALHELADTISHDIRSYADYLDHGFAYVRDLDLRVKQSERAIARARSLNDCLGSISVHEVVTVSHLNSRLRHLLQAGFAVSIRRSKQELVNTLHRLNELLVTLRRDSELSKLLRVFEIKFKNEPGFQPEVPAILEHVPQALDIAAPLLRPDNIPPAESKKRPQWGDIYNPLQQDDLADIVRKLRNYNSFQRKAPEEESGPVEDSRAQIAEVEPGHPIVESARSLVKALQKINKPVSLVETRNTLKIACPPSLWMTTVMNIIEALPEYERLQYRVHFIEKPHKCYSGNRWVEDIKVRYGGADEFVGIADQK